MLFISTSSQAICTLPGMILDTICTEFQFYKLLLKSESLIQIYPGFYRNGLALNI